MPNKLSQKRQSTRPPQPSRPNVGARDSKYCVAVREFVAMAGHASNAAILHGLRQIFPSVSATTIHRITARLLRRDELGLAPNDVDGALRYDANTLEHDHFMCQNCGRLRDLRIPVRLKKRLAKQVESGAQRGCLTVIGQCENCEDSEAEDD